MPSLADLATVYTVVRTMRIVPFGVDDVTQLFGRWLCRANTFGSQNLITVRTPENTAVFFPSPGLMICKSAPRLSHGVKAKL